MLYEPPTGKGEPFLNHGFLDEVFGDWQFNEIFTLGSGLPFIFSDGVDVANTGTENERPSYSGATLAPTGGKSRFHWFNNTSYNQPGAAYVEPAQYTFGDFPATACMVPVSFRGTLR